MYVNKYETNTNGT